MNFGSSCFKLLKGVTAGNSAKGWASALTLKGKAMGLKMKIVAFLTALACFAATAQAQSVISLNFGADQTYSGGAGTAALAPTDTAGYLPSMNWNNLSGTSGTATGLLANDGSTTGVSVTWGGPGDTWNSGGTPTTPDQNMLYGYDDAGSGGALKVTVSGLPASLTSDYALLVYTAGDEPGNADRRLHGEWNDDPVYPRQQQHPLRPRPQRHCRQRDRVLGPEHQHLVLGRGHPVPRR